MKSEQTKENIIHQTILLIEENKGNITDITIRKIAERAQVGIGLINHYFFSKDNLIEVCIQRIISNVVLSFNIDDCVEKDPKDVTKYVARQVVDFLIVNREIAKVSILGNLNYPKEKDNTINTAFGFAYCMSGGVNPEKHLKKAFILVAILQESFLRKDLLNNEIGVDFFDKNHRDTYINELVNMVMEASI